MTLTMAAVSIAVVAIGASAAAAHNRGASNWINCRTSSQSLVLLPHRRSSLVLSATRRRAVSWLVNQRAVVLRSQNNKRSGSCTDCSSKAAFRLGVRLLHALGSGVLDSFSGSVGCDPLQEDSLFQLRPTVHGRHDEQRKRFFISMVFETNHRCYLHGHAWRMRGEFWLSGSERAPGLPRLSLARRAGSRPGITHPESIQWAAFYGGFKGEGRKEDPSHFLCRVKPELFSILLDQGAAQGEAQPGAQAAGSLGVVRA